MSPKGIENNPLTAHFGAPPVSESKPETPEGPPPKKRAATAVRKPPAKPAKVVGKEVDLESPKTSVQIRIPIDLLERLRNVAAFTPETVTSLLVSGGVERLKKAENEYLERFGMEIPTQRD